MAYEKAEAEAAIAAIKEARLWEMNMKLPENCGNETCSHVKKWVSIKGVDESASDMKNFQASDVNATLDDYNMDLVMFEDQENKIKEMRPQAEAMMKMILAMLEKDIEIANKTTKKVRILADTTIGLEEVDDSDADALDAGQDAQVDEEYADAAEEIDQTEPTKDLEAVDNISEADSGIIGDDSTVTDDDEGSKGTSFMTWVMYIGGAILVLILIAGAVHVV